MEDFLRGNSHPVEKIRKGLMEEVMLEVSFKGSNFQTQRCRRGEVCRWGTAWTVAGRLKRCAQETQ